MAEKTYPMTLAEKEKLELELEELKLVRRPEVVERIKIAMVTSQKTLSMKQQKMNKLLLRVKSLAWKQKSVMRKSSIVTLLQ